MRQWTTAFRRIPRFIAIAVAGLCVALLLAACEGSSDPAGNVGSGPAEEPDATVVAVNTAYEPDSLELPAGEEVTLEIVNDDDTTHDFAIEDLDLNTGTIEPDEVATATFTVLEGTTEFICTFHGGMTGTIEGT